MDRILNAAIGVVTIIALVSGTLVLYRAFGGGDGARNSLPVGAIQRVDDWKRYNNAASDARVGDGGVTIVVFGDYQCPHCAALDSTLDQLKTKHGVGVELVFRHLPLRVGSREAALAVECAGEQGYFEGYHRALYTLADSIGQISWGEMAERVGVPDTLSLLECMSDEAIAQRIDRDHADALELGATGTPIMLVKDILVLGAIPFGVLDALVERASG